jgi:hypothetical protein
LHENYNNGHGDKHVHQDGMSNLFSIQISTIGPEEQLKITTGSVTDLLLSCLLAAAKERSFFLSWLPKVHMGYHNGNLEYEFHDIIYDLPGGAGCVSAYH